MPDIAASSTGDSYARFPQTSWGLIRQAVLATPSERARGLNELLRRYWKPLYAFYRCRGLSASDAQDLVQDFVTGLIERGKLRLLDKPEKRFRDWLLVCARNFLHDHFRKRRARKRRPPKGLASFEQLRARDGDPFEPAAAEDADAAFLDAWRRDLLDHALQAVELECEADGRSADYRIFVEYYMPPEEPRPSWRQLGERHRLAGWKEAARRAERVKRRLARAIRRLVSLYVADEEQIEEELRDLLR